MTASHFHCMTQAKTPEHIQRDMQLCVQNWSQNYSAGPVQQVTKFKFVLLVITNHFALHVSCSLSVCMSVCVCVKSGGFVHDITINTYR